MTTNGQSKKSKVTPLATPPFNLSDEKNPSFSSCVQGVARLLHGRKNIVVLVGAGISVSCGIPDFRSKDSGLYSTLDIGELGLSCPEELFDWDFFQEDPTPFYKFARHLYYPLGEDKKVEPSDSHKLLAMLEEKKMLLRVYSQNIDGLENVAGVSNKKMVYAHGSLQWAKCMTCQRKVSSEDILSAIRKGCVPRCQAEKKSRRNPNTCEGSSPSRPSTPREASQRTKKRQRTSSNICGGVFKPAVTFFGETLNDSVRRCLEADRNKVDALVVIGTSLSVAPISKVIEYLPPKIPRILINRTIVHPSTSSVEDNEHEDGDGDDEKEFRENYVFDAYLLGFCDDVTRALARQLFKRPDPPEKPYPPSKTGKDPYGGRLLTSVLKDEDDEYEADDWSSLPAPAERVILFHGALASKDDTSEVTYREVVHCDGCYKRIHGKIRKCLTCFDYDLCQKCFPSLSKSHYDGKHTFTAEPASV